MSLAGPLARGLHAPCSTPIHTKVLEAERGQRRAMSARKALACRWMPTRFCLPSYPDFHPSYSLLSPFSDIRHLSLIVLENSRSDSLTEMSKVFLKAPARINSETSFWELRLNISQIWLRVTNEGVAKRTTAVRAVVLKRSFSSAQGETIFSL